MTTVDHNGAAAAKPPYQDAALMLSGGEARQSEGPDLGEEPADPRTCTCALHRVINCFYSFGKQEQLDKALM